MPDATKTKLIVPGREVPPRPERVDAEVEARFGVDIKTEHTVEMTGVERGIAERFESPELADDVVVELEYEDGFRQWTTVGQLRTQLRRTDRARVEGDAVFVPRTLPLTAGVRRQRGVVDLTLKGLKLLNIDPIDAAVGETVEKAIEHIEGALAPGLYAFDENGDLVGGEDAEPTTLPEVDGPSLVFLHGTFSTTQGSFAALLKKDGSTVPTDEWRKLYDFYEGRVFGFDHRTLGDSPAENARQLLEAVPHEARLHLVSHSRGGLIGELLAHGPLSDAQIRLFEQRGRPADEIETLHALTDLLHDREPRIERFVRVAAPGRGTVLASDRLDRYLSIVLNLIARIPAVEGSIVYPLAKAAILTLVKKRADPEDLPGLEALMPRSPLVRLLNDPKTTSPADLAVVAGDIQGESALGRLVVFATDLFYWEDHDLVVNTRSMYQGVGRERSPYFAFHRGGTIHHFQYFLNPESRRQMHDWLTRKNVDDVPPGFEELTPVTLKELDRGIFRGDLPPDAPVVFVIPGLMASHLEHEDRRVWFDFAALADGDFGKLALKRDGADRIHVDDIIATNYQDLLSFLGSQFEVVTFPYDWRRSVLEEGDRLAVEIEATLRRLGPDRAAYLLAHSQGGLVAHAMMARHPETWKQVAKRGGRLVMLGTPTRGTFTALQLLTGQAPAVQMLDMLDPVCDADQIARTLRTFPGLAELLPEVAGGDVWDVAWWEQHTTIEFAERSAFAKVLRDAKQARTVLTGTIDPDRTCYVAGTATETLSGVRFDGDGTTLVYLATGQGDGVVPHRLGIPDDVPTWYVEAPHGDLANHRPVFPALAGLLRTGTTDMLSGSAAVRGLAVSYDVHEPQPMLFPTEHELVAAATGSGMPTPDVEDVMALRVSVAHGSLEHAQYPVAVGHYYGDVMDGAAQFLDRKLNGRLTTRLRVHLFSGQDGTAEVVLAPKSRPRGGLVVGLGEVGRITPAKLTKGVTVAALRYALAVVEEDAAENIGTDWRSAAFSAVLIGTQGGQGLSTEGSISAVVQGAMAANWALRDRGLWDRVRIDEIEFVELYEDIATHAAHVITDLQDNLRVHRENRERIDALPYMRTIEGGLPGSPALEYHTGWWRRLQITTPDDGAHTADASGLSFVMLTDRARAEETLQPTQQRLVNQFVEQSISQPSYSGQLSATLYELLFPNTLKDQSQEIGNLVLVLDKVAARYPWEMLAERRQDDKLVPLVSRVGLLRQLRTSRFRPRVQPPRGHNALVVGDPTLRNQADYPPLPGAEAEAHTVADVLSKSAFSVTSLVGRDATALAITNALFEREYRVLHVAAHGIYDADNPAQSGVVIGDDIFLTAAEVAQLRVVPELVFLNCCHLATVDQPERDGDRREQAGTAQAWNRLAASISEELIGIGVRAVVAAGWAVDDEAAQTFASAFYEQMLAGRQFGEAVRLARIETYAAHENTNTWGAYQCYGDPGFVLGTGTGRALVDRPAPVAANEVVRELERLCERAATLNAAQRKKELEELSTLRETLRDEWRTGRMLYHLGNAYSELGDFAEAIRCYELALARETIDVERVDVPFRAVDQLANLQARYAARLQKRDADTGDEESAFDPEALLQAAIRNLTWILDIAETPHRRALLGASYKRFALICDDEKRPTYLREAEACYERAHRKHVQEVGRFAPYYTLNWLTLRFLQNDLASDETRAKALELIEESRKAGEERRTLEPNFWDRIAVPDAALLEALVEGNLGARVEQIQQRYLLEFGTGATARERATVIEQIDFLIEILAWQGRDEQVPALRRLRNGLV